MFYGVLRLTFPLWINTTPLFPLENSKMKYTKNCLFCSKEFITGQPQAKFCCGTCNGRYNNLIKRRNSTLHKFDFKEFVFERDNFVCFFCQQRFDKPYTALHLHHKIPLFQGGLDTTDNCVPACVPCHKKFHRIKE